MRQAQAQTMNGDVSNQNMEQAPLGWVNYYQDWIQEEMVDVLFWLLE